MFVLFILCVVVVVVFKALFDILDMVEYDIEQVIQET